MRGRHRKRTRTCSIGRRSSMEGRRLQTGDPCRERSIEGEETTAEDLSVLSDQRPSEVNELTVQDDITGAEQL